MKQAVISPRWVFFSICEVNFEIPKLAWLISFKFTRNHSYCIGILPLIIFFQPSVINTRVLNHKGLPLLYNNKCPFVALMCRHWMYEEIFISLLHMQGHAVSWWAK